MAGEDDYGVCILHEPALYSNPSRLSIESDRQDVLFADFIVLIIILYLSLPFVAIVPCLHETLPLALCQRLVNTFR